MDDMRAFEREEEIARHDDACDVAERPPQIGSDERRMHVRAYNFWVSLLGGRAYPSIEDLEPSEAVDFGPHSVLLDFTGGLKDPAIAYLGEALRRECGLSREIHSIADVPARSLLSRLTDHYLQILANRAPIGFEAEFVSQRGNNTMYRGILMPFSSDDDTIDFVYGVINWKELEDAPPAPVDQIAAEPLIAPAPEPASPAFADGPGGDLADAPMRAALPLDLPLVAEPGEPDASPDEDANADDDGRPADIDALQPGHNAALADHLAAARDQAELAQGARIKSRAALYRALGLAYDFSCLAQSRPAEYRELLDDTGIKVQARAPMTALIKLVFGIQVDKARLTEFAATLAQAQRLDLAPGALPEFLDAQPGGLKAMVAAERVARRPVTAPPTHAAIARAALRKVAPQAMLDLASDDEEFVLLLARREQDGRLAVIAPIPQEQTLVDRAIRKITR
jgi:hypothetical protein